MENNRLKWADQVKALLIFCVVFGHIGIFSMHGVTGFWSRLQDLFCMPFFFFISGFFVKPLDNLGKQISSIISKGRKLLIPFCTCGLAYTILYHQDLPWWSLFYHPNGEAHNGYWFLLVLFEMYAIITIFQILLTLMHRKQLGGAFFIMSAMTAVLLLIISYFKIIPEEPWCTLISFHRLHYNFPFFVIGIYCGCHKEKMESLISKRNFSISLLMFLPLYFIRDRYDIKGWPLSYLLIICCIVILLYLFVHHGSRLPFQKSINIIGRNTLELYVLHYFFLPNNVPFLRSLIFPNDVMDSNIILELLLCSLFALLVITITSVIAKLLKQSSILGVVLFGDLWKR